MYKTSMGSQLNARQIRHLYVGAHTRNHCSHGEAIGIKYFGHVCVCVHAQVRIFVLVTQHANHISPVPYYSATCGSSGSTIFLNIMS
jgi:hypothetical protein